MARFIDLLVLLPLFLVLPAASSLPNKILQPGFNLTTISSFESLKSCLLNSFVPIENIFNQDSTPEEYNQLNSQWNKYNGKIYPLGYLVPNTTLEIQKAVLCSKSLNIRVIPKSGGHNFPKYTFGDNNTLIIDLKKLNHVIVQQHGTNATAIIGAGTRFGKLGYELYVQGYTSQIGDCPSVSVAGYTLGGGQGIFGRRQGLLSDNVIELHLIDAHGRLLIVNQDMNPDLYWALRGAGGGAQFGIVTQFIVKIYPKPYQVVRYNLRYNLQQDFVQVYQALQIFSTSTLWNNTYIKTRLNINLNEINVGFNELRYENESVEFESIIQIFPPNYSNNLTFLTTNYAQFIMENGLITYGNTLKPNINITQPSDLINIGDSIGEIYNHVKSIQIPRLLTTDEIQVFNNLMREYLNNTAITFKTNGGKINDYNTNDTAYVHRNDLFTLLLIYEGEDIDLNWINNTNIFFNKTQELFGHTRSYQNYVDPIMENYLQRYYGQNLGRLIDIKTKYDPENFFYTPQSITPKTR